MLLQGTPLINKLQQKGLSRICCRSDYLEFEAEVIIMNMQQKCLPRICSRCDNLRFTAETITKASGKTDNKINHTYGVLWCWYSSTEAIILSDCTDVRTITM